MYKITCNGKEWEIEKLEEAKEKIKELKKLGKPIKVLENGLVAYEYVKKERK